jgi:hypothetical protein
MKIWNNTFFDGAEFTKVRTDKKYHGRRNVLTVQGIHLAEGKSVPRNFVLVGSGLDGSM